MVEVGCRGLLFDLDGVLVDSTPAVARVWTRWALAHGFDPEDTVRRAHGRPSIETIRGLLPDVDAEAENRIVEQGELDDTEGVVPLPGARELLNSLGGERWAIVTSCTRPLAETRLKAAGLPVPQRMITSNEIRSGKPNPEPYLKGAALLGVPAEDCVVFEDAPAGIHAAKAAGAIVVAFPTTSPVLDLDAAGADFVLSGFPSLTLLSANGSLRMRLVLTS
jgi:mannitol-1-/sugar-/sorbitol-6-phosphatase